MAKTYYSLMTAAGLAYEAARKAAGLPVLLTEVSAGDGGGADYDPADTALALRREVWRGALSDLYQYAPQANWLVAEGVIPVGSGGYTVREAGIWTDTGVLYAICKYPATLKPLPVDGSGKEIQLRVFFKTTNAAIVDLTLSGSETQASRAWVTEQIANHEAKPDPHPQYAKGSELAQHIAAADPHPQYFNQVRYDIAQRSSRAKRMYLATGM